MNAKLGRAVLIVGGLLLLALTWLGVKGGIEQWPQANSVTRRVQTLAQFAYGLLSLMMLIAMVSWPNIRRGMSVSWLVCLTVAGGLGPVAWGDAGWGPSAIAAVATLLVGLLILRPLERAARGRTSG